MELVLSPGNIFDDSFIIIWSAHPKDELQK